MHFTLLLTLVVVVALPLLISASPEEFDTIEITASRDLSDDTPRHRDKRQSLELIPYPHRDSANPPETRATISIKCKTARNEDGVCKPFKECYPLFFLRDSEEEKVEVDVEYRKSGQIIPAVQENPGSFELEKIYRNISGPCDKELLDAISTINIGKGVPMTEYVCCPTEKKKPTNQPSRPPAPSVPRPEVMGDKKCGNVFVTYKNLEEAIQSANSTADDPLVLRIVNGRQASKGEFPWTVALLNNGVQFCGGSLISSEHILTAAHCVYYMNQKDVTKMRMYIGDHNVYTKDDGPHEERSASNIYYHRGFSMSTLYDDIAVIRLEKPVTFGKYIQPVCLHNGIPRYDTGTTGADVTGWGLITDKGPPSLVLNTVQVRVMTQNECIKAYGKKAPAGISAGMVCAGGNGRDSCKGDSGGPLTIDSHSKAKQIGVVSWGVGCATYPGVYTRVDKYLSWVYKNQR